jgi:hypothetical protein
VGTYNAIIPPNAFYSPAYSTFASSHKTFKRMMPVFAWEVLEVYSGPPTVAFRWRHWGVMKNDYVGINDAGEKVTAKAHGREISIEGVTVANVNSNVQLQAVRTWFDPLDMFRQIAPEGDVGREKWEQGKDAGEVVEEEHRARGVRVSNEQELPDATVQSGEEVREMVDGLEREEKSGVIPEGHPVVEEGAGCPFGFR